MVFRKENALKSKIYRIKYRKNLYNTFSNSLTKILVKNLNHEIDLVLS